MSIVYPCLILCLKNFMTNILPCKIIDMTCRSLKRIFSRSILSYFGQIVTSLFKSIPPSQLSWCILYCTDNNHAHYAQDEILTNHSHKRSEHNAYLNKLRYHDLQDSMVYMYTNFCFVHMAHCSIYKCNAIYYDMSCGLDESK